MSSADASSSSPAPSRARARARARGRLASTRATRATRVADARDDARIARASGATPNVGVMKNPVVVAKTGRTRALVKRRKHYY